MPKQIFKIDSFVGGLNTATDKQAIEDMELSLSDGIETFDKGRVNLIGQFETQTYDNPLAGMGIQDFDCYPGTGLFQFKSDKTNGHIHYYHQFGEVTSVESAIGNTPAQATITFEYIIEDSETPADAWKDCEFSVRSDGGVTPGSKAKIIGSSANLNEYAGGELIAQSINIEFSSTGYDEILDGSEGVSSLIDIGARVLLISKNEEVEYLAKSSFTPSNLNDGNSAVQLYSDQKEGGKTWGPLEFGYPLGTRLNFRPKTSFYYVDGALRWSDGEARNFSATDQKSNQFLGYIKTSIVHNNHEHNTGDKRISLLECNGWWQGDAFLSPPVIGDARDNVLLVYSPITWSGSDTTFPDSIGEFMVSIQYNLDNDDYDGTGTLEESNYTFYVSYIYQGGGESVLSELGSINMVNDNSNMVMQIALNSRDFLGDRRILGIKLYWQKPGTTGYVSSVSRNYMLLGEFHIEKGFKAATESSYIQLFYETADSNINKEGIISREYEFRDPPLISSWESETGHLRADVVTDVRFQTSVVANRKVYIGNITYDGSNYEDLILQSRAHEFDTFPFSNRMETTKLDGSEVVKLEEFADRLLQFKSDRLDIINISGELDILEESFPYKGVRTSGAVCKTDYGVAWVNEDGCYLFDGTQIVNLLERQNVRLIDAKEWKDFIKFGKVSDIANGYDNSEIKVSPIIGYLPKDRRLIITNSDCLTNEGSTEFYMFNIISQSWAKSQPGETGLKHAFDSVGHYLSNFVVDRNGDLIVALGKTHAYGSGQGELKVFKDKHTQTIVDRDFELWTKAYDFGMPGVSKKIHKVYFHYKGGGSKISLQIYADIEGDASELHRFADSSGSADDTPLSDSLSSDNTEGFKIYNNTAKNVKRIWFRIRGINLDYNFELYDINVVFRPKSIK